MLLAVRLVLGLLALQPEADPWGFDDVQAEETWADTPASWRWWRSRTSAIGERHWLAVQSKSTSMGGL